MGCSQLGFDLEACGWRDTSWGWSVQACVCVSRGGCLSAAQLLSCQGRLSTRVLPVPEYIFLSSVDNACRGFLPQCLNNCAHGTTNRQSHCAFLPPPPPHKRWSALTLACLDFSGRLCTAHYFWDRLPQISLQTAFIIDRIDRLVSGEAGTGIWVPWR